MKMRWLLLIVLLAGLAHADLPGFSGDLKWPDWYKQENTTLQAWNFDSCKSVVAPNIDENPYGDPFANIIRPNNKTRWMEDYSGREGVWRLGKGGVMALFVPNTSNTAIDSYKEIWVQILWSASSIDYAPSLWVQTADADPAYAHEIQTMPFGKHDNCTEGNGTTGSDNFYHSLYKIDLQPNPMEEWIFIKSGHRRHPVYIDEIIVDTRCIPEPATTALLGIGGLGVFGIRRVRRKGLAGLLEVPAFRWRNYTFELAAAQAVEPENSIGDAIWKWYFRFEKAVFKAAAKGSDTLLALLVPQVFVRCACPECNSLNIRPSHRSRGRWMRIFRLHHYTCKDCHRHFVSGA